jgi:hypothetical protein
MMQVPVSFEAWLRRLLSKRPADRYTTAADALDALRHLPDDGPTAAEIVREARARGLFLRDAGPMGRQLGTQLHKALLRRHKALMVS